jgi:AraC family transcriptional regulator, regulatory protein of adaptative response / methylated-DNA-[protein]-cysteine methyltransferase
LPALFLCARNLLIQEDNFDRKLRIWTFLLCRHNQDIVNGQKLQRSTIMLAVAQDSGIYVVPKPEPISTQTQALRAVMERDRRYDGLFVYAVKSTGVYCRPSCPSRRPGAEQVEFFEKPNLAESAGYRSCRRCRPTEANGHGPIPQMITKVCRVLDANPEEEPTLEQLSEVAGLSPFHLQRSFKQAVGISPRQYAELRRFLRFRTRLQKGDDVTTAMYEAGFQSPSRLYERSTSALGMTPSAYKAGAPGQTIRYTIADSSLGRILVAMTDKGVCAVRFGDSDRTMESELKAEFPKAEFARDDKELAGTLRQVLAIAEGKGATDEIPLDIRHTAFQWKVWQALRNIAPGQTKSYREVATEIGDPKAVRAVAKACATNPVALVIPCHRVVRSDGQLSGYRWGVDRKKRLLESEKRWK